MDMEETQRASDLKPLAEAKFGKLSDAEKLLLEKAPSGDFAICGPNREDTDPSNDPKEAYQWGKARQIRAVLVAWLCTDHEARKRVHWRGIQVYGADITGFLDLELVIIPFQLAFERCRLKRATDLSQPEEPLKEAIDLSQAEVSQLNLRGSLVYGITADSLIVKNNVFLDSGFVASGEVRFPLAQIGGNLQCDNGTFNAITHPPQKDLCKALNAEGINVKGYVYLRGSFTANGEVSLMGAQIGSSLDCSGGTFTNPPKADFPGNSMALNATLIRVKDMVLFSEFKTADDQSDLFTADGYVSLYGAQIEGTFRCAKGKFAKATLDLRDASAGTIYDPGVEWPAKGALHLDSFAYGRISTEQQISTEERIDVVERLGWLGRQPSPPFLRRPYLQLAKVLRESGDSDGALQVLEKMEELRRSAEEPGPSKWLGRKTGKRIARLWSFVLKKSIGYGYHPGNAIWFIVALSVLGSAVYGISYHAGTMVPTEKEAYQDFRAVRQVPPHYPTFSPLVYSAENSLPLVKMGQTDKWQPDPEPGSLLATSVTWFLRIQILLGWLLATLFVAGVSGIVHKE
jgi:hypothetical protein